MTCPFLPACARRVERGLEPAPLLLGQRCLLCPGVDVESLDVVATGHVVDRVRERTPERGWVSGIKKDVLEALRAGRVSSEYPYWFRGLAMPKVPADAAYVWPLDRDVIYVITRHAKGKIHVQTILTVDGEEAA